MLDVIYELEKVRLSQMFKRCTVFSVQIDGSCDRQMLDHKFVSGRMASSDSSVTSVFVVMHSPEKNGAPGLLEAVNKTLDLTGGKDTKLVGVTTDGESANTGRHGGLWRLLADQVQRGLATFWCAAHRSDLAIESVISTVPELGIWKSNLLRLVRFFRTPRRMKMLSTKAGNVKQFPWHHDVRFAQHELQLVDAVLNNVPTCSNVWEQMQAPESTSDRKEKAEAKGFLKIWNHQQKWTTSLMGDILEIFETLQKKLQRSDLFISDLLTVTGAAVKKLRLMRGGLFLGRREEKESCPTDSASEDLTQRKSNHQFVCTNRHNARAIRLEVVQASHEYLSERIHPEQEDVIKDMKGLVISRNLGSFVEHCVRVVRRLFPDEASDFADGAAEHCENMMNVPFLPDGCDLGYRKDREPPQPRGRQSPHQHGEDTTDARLMVALNGVGTAYFDPRPAVVKFLEKTRRWELQIWTSTGSVNSLGNSPAKRGSFSKIETTVKRTDLQVARDVTRLENYNFEITRWSYMSTFVSGVSGIAAEVKRAVNTNGAISFEDEVSTYKPKSFPLSGNTRLIAAFWTDIDTRVNSGRVYYRQSTNREIVQRATDDVRRAFPGSQFAAGWVFIATWHKVSYFSGSNTTPVNTLQIVLVTNGHSSFAILNYGDISWKGKPGSKPAQVGFNAGDGKRYFSVPGSLTDAVVDIETTSNVKLPGRWMFRIDQETIVSVTVKCEPLESPPHGSKEGTSSSVGAVTTFSCDDGYRLHGSTQRKCTGDRSWDGVETTCVEIHCGSLVAPTHGSASGSSDTVGSVVLFSCDAGFRLIGSPQRTCQQNGNWDGEDATCDEIHCGVLKTPSHGSRNGNSDVVNSTVKFSCDHGFRLDGSVQRNCTDEGTWDGVDTTCIEIHCGPLATPTHSSASGSSDTVGSVVAFSCDIGFRLKGTSSRECQEDGNWDGEDILCDEIHCGFLATPSRSRMRGSSDTVGSVATFSCDAGFRLKGSSQRTCQQNGNWDGDDITCDEIHCGSLVTPSHGSASGSSDTVGSIVVFSCDAGFRLKGPSQRTCQQNGNWDGDVICDANEVVSESRSSVRMILGLFGAGFVFLLIPPAVAMLISRKRKTQQTRVDTSRNPNRF
ncbi:hypothetical protein LSAT2_025993 [Lamellibrachia satsuma]|nr:hypothetical protein LSAT2_025993 [Lamellibrachia satsuma]